MPSPGIRSGGKHDLAADPENQPGVLVPGWEEGARD